MSPWVVRELTHDDVPMFPIEVGCLEAVSREDDLSASSRRRFLFRRAEETAAEARVAPSFIHPEESDFSDTAPRVTTDASVDSPSRISEEHHKQACIMNAGRREVVLVHLLFEELEVFERRVVFHHDLRVTHSHMIRHHEAFA